MQLQKVLNFGEKDKTKIIELLKQFEAKATKTSFEEMRVKVKNSTVTLYSSGKTVIQGNDCEEVKKWFLSEMKLDSERIVGIDETGRGERHGPFVISAVLGEENNLREIRDSKKTKKLEEKIGIITENSEFQAVFSFNSSYVDRLRNKGLNLNEIESQVIESIKELFKNLDEKVEIIADGKPLNSKLAGVKFLVKGDDKNTVISAASNLAKFFREQSKDKNERKSWKAEK
ncbi:MAG: DUF3378 domain-containing protein [archaeon]|nr:DUF3378 domain-containing protein [archaeon]